jgi:hypothetical protein
MRTPVKHTSSASKKSRFSVLLTKEERESLEKIARERGVTCADIIRMFVRGQNFFRAA